jgi:hypothetical protein
MGPLLRTALEPPLLVEEAIVKTDGPEELQQPSSMSCKTKHSPKTDTTSRSPSRNDSHTHHATYTTTSKPKHPS